MSALEENFKRIRVGMPVDFLAFIYSYCMYMCVSGGNCMVVAEWKRSIICMICMCVAA